MVREEKMKPQDKEKIRGRQEMGSGKMGKDGDGREGEERGGEDVAGKEEGRTAWERK